jgi:hypothetical protein
MKDDKLMRAWFIICGTLGVIWLVFMGWFIVTMVGWVTTK